MAADGTAAADNVRPGGRLRYLSHLETMRLWERAMRRAGWSSATARASTPTPKMSFAAALPVGVAGEAELMDVQLEEAQQMEQAPART